MEYALDHYGPDQLVCIMYYSTSPYDCPQHAQRWNFYGGSGVPDSYWDGYEQRLGGIPSDDAYIPIIEDHLETMSPLRMNLTMSIVGSNGTVDGEIEVVGNVPLGEYAVHVVVYEVNAARTPNLARIFPVNNVPLTAYANGETQDVSGTFTVGGDWNASNLYAILFVQYLGNGTMIVAGPGEGPDNLNNVQLYPVDQMNWESVDIDVYGPDKYGVNVACGDIDGDMADEVITGPGPGRVFGPHVRAFEFDGTQTAGASFFAYGTPKYGVNVAAGDIDGDGNAEIITGAGPGKVFGPHVRAFNHDGTGSVTPIGTVSFFAYGTWKYGVNVAAGDLDGDGYDEIVTGAGPGKVFGPHVRGWNYDGSSIQSMSTVSFLAYGTNKYGVNVTCGDIDGDGYDEIVTGAGPGAVFGPHVRGWNVDGGSASSIPQVNIIAFDYTQYGVCVGTGDVDSDGIDEILVGAGPNPDVNGLFKIYNYDGANTTLWYDGELFKRVDITHGVNVTAGTF